MWIIIAAKKIRNVNSKPQFTCYVVFIYLKWFIAATMSVPTSIPLKIRLNTMCINILMVNLIKAFCFFHIIFISDWQHLHIIKENQSQQEESELLRLLKPLDIKLHVFSLWRMLEELYCVTISHMYLCTIENYLLIINSLNSQNVSLLFIFNIHPR